MLPIMAGAVVVVYNINGLTKSDVKLRLRPETLADIWMNKVCADMCVDMTVDRCAYINADMGVDI